MRIQTWHLLEYQSPWRNQRADLLPTRKGWTALQARYNINISYKISSNSLNPKK